MDFTEFVLAGVVTELPDMSDRLSAADALAYQIHGDSEVTSLRKFNGELPVIAGNSSFSGDDEDREQTFRTLETAAKIESVEAVEVDFELVDHDETIINNLRTQEVDIIVSYRNFIETPNISTLISIAKDAAEYGDIVYIETKAESLDDSLQLLNTILRATESGISIGGACMGDVGYHTRVAAPVYGSKLAYAPLAVDDSEEDLDKYSLSELAELIQEFKEPSVQTSLHDKISDSIVWEE